MRLGGLALLAGAMVATSVFAKDLSGLVPEKYKGATVTVGTAATLPGVESVEPGTGRIVGVEPDLAYAVARKLGIKVEISNVAFDGLLASLQAGRYDVAMAGLADTVQRQQAMDFVDWYVSGLRLIVPKGNPKKVSGPGNLCGLTLGGARASTQLRQMERVAKDCGAKATPLVATDTTPAGLLLLNTGRVDVYAVDAMAAPGYVKAKPELELIAGEFFPLVRGVGFAKDNTGLRDAWQAGLKAVIDSGEYDEILKRWGMSGIAYKQATINGGKL
ncbi:hypothetical protein RO07_15725 [Pandoraea pulmonicola]|nr:hypothetical protein RO07_15725 [Pandoraea pulmonicola]